jgi:hypothetical protein
MTTSDPASNDSARAEATFFRPEDDIQVHRGNLPHWRQDRVTYFITTRLADSMPQEKLREWQEKRDAWLAAHGLPSITELHHLAEDLQHEFHASFTKEWQTWLDAGYGECQLRRPDVRDILTTRLLSEPSLDAWVIMPNHLHALVTPQDKPLGDVLQSWKGGSAFEINRLLGRSGPLWQKEPYDHIVRSEAQLQHYRLYIAENPTKAHLREDEYAVGLGSCVFKVASALAESLNP